MKLLHVQQVKGGHRVMPEDRLNAPNKTVGRSASICILGLQETTQGAKERDLVTQVSSRVFVRADPCRQGERRLMAGGMAVAVVRVEISLNSPPERSER